MELRLFLFIQVFQLTSQILSNIHVTALWTQSLGLLNDSESDLDTNSEWTILQPDSPLPIIDHDIFPDLSFTRGDDGEGNVNGRGISERKKYVREAKGGSDSDYFKTCRWNVQMKPKKQVKILSARYGKTNDQYPADSVCDWIFLGRSTCIPQIICSTIDLRKKKNGDGTPGNDCEDTLTIFDAWTGSVSLCGEASFTAPKRPIGSSHDLFVTMKTGSSPTFDRHYKGVECKVTCLKSSPTPELLPTSNGLFKTDSNCKCGLKPDQRVVGGLDAKPFEFPWQVGIVKRGKRSTFCGGTLLNSEFVVTAAHCFEGNLNSLEQYEVLIHLHQLNLKDSDENTVRRQLVKGYIHPFYRGEPTFDYDVCVLKLASPVDIIANTPICLTPPGNHKNSEAGQKVTVTGFGRLSEGGHQANILQKLEMPIVSVGQCAKTLSGVITDRMLCAGNLDGGQDACQGDSGGPLIKLQTPNHFWELVGIVSWGEGCARKSLAGVYSRVSELTQWIRRKSMEGTWCSGH